MIALRQPLLWWVTGICALGMLAGCQHGTTPPLAVRNALADSADQVLYHTKSVLTDNGVMKAEVYADTGYLFDDNTRVEMRVVKTVFFTATGARNAVLTSREGTYNTRSDNMEARGDVVVVSEDGRRLTTPELRYGQTRNEIMSDSSFVLTDSTQKMTGVGFVSDPNMNNVRCLKACAGSAGMVTLPGAPGDTTRVAPPVHRPTPALPPSAGIPGAAAPSPVPPPAAGRTTAPGVSSTAPTIAPSGAPSAGAKPTATPPASPAPVAAPDSSSSKTAAPRLPPSGHGTS